MSFFLKAPVLIKSFFFNKKLFGLKKAIKLPIIIGLGVNVKEVKKGSVEFSCPIKRGMVCLGCNEGTTGIWNGGRIKGCFETDEKSKVVFGDNVTLAKGFTIKALNGGRLTLNDGFRANPYTRIFCRRQISFGKDCMLGWSITVNDGDGHSVLDAQTGEKLNDYKPISIGNHVWIGAESSVLKSSVIPDNCIVGYGTIVGKRFENENSVIAGPFPAREVKSGVNWEK